jgi:hypothetical protein
MSKSKPKPQRKSPTGSSPASKPKSAPVVPSFDATFAIEAAAAMVGGRSSKSTPKPVRKESLEFRLLKEEINEPGMLSLDQLLDKTDNTVSKRSHKPLEHNNRQVGHNQTFGADVNRSGVPRRTGG